MTHDILFPADDIYALTECMHREAIGVAWTVGINNTIQRLTDIFNISGKDTLLDAIMEGMDNTHETLAYADRIEELFVDMVTHCTRNGYQTLVQYDINANAFLISLVANNIQSKLISQMKREYQTSIDQDDFYPERTRIQFDRLLAQH